MLTAEQLIAAQKANLDTLFGLTAKAFEGVEKLVELNLQVAKTAMAEASETTKAVMSVKDAQELVALQASMLQPTAEKAAAYSRHLYDIAAGTGAEVTKVAEATAAEAQQKFMAVVDGAIKNAPAGSEGAVTLVKSAMAAASNAYETAQKAAKQAAEVTEANMQALTSTAVKATQAATKIKRAA
jgi:phasin family protein